MTVATVERAPLGLDELATIANTEHDAVGAALVDALNHAVMCGTALLAAKAQCEPDEWHRWWNENLSFSIQHGGKYMRLAHYKDQLPAEAFRPWTDSHGRVRQPTLRHSALTYLRGLPPISDPVGVRRIRAEVKSEIKRLHRDNVPDRDIAEILGVSRTTVHFTLNPDALQQAKARGSERRRLARMGESAGKAERKRLERQRLAKQAGGSLADAYGLVRRAAQRLDEATVTADTPQQRALIANALTRTHTAEDAIVSALRASRENK